MSGPRVGIVVIGRNGGERLKVALRSCLDLGFPTVYADSGSSDGSAEAAGDEGAQVVALDPSRPFTASRGRAEGFARLLEIAPGVEFIQFLDGDCELSPGWLEAGLRALGADPRLGGACGQRRELDPGRSLFHQQLSLDWHVPLGEASWFCGDALLRVSAYRAAGGFDPELVSGEEPDLCLRMRVAGWTLRRIDAAMSVHDGGELSFRGWWLRGLRTGTSYSRANAKHGGRLVGHRGRKLRNVFLWGGILPGAALALAWPTRGVSLLLLAVYPVLAVRAWNEGRLQGLGEREASFHALFSVLNRFPQFWGALFDRMGLRRRASFFYKER